MRLLPRVAASTLVIAYLGMASAFAAGPARVEDYVMKPQKVTERIYAVITPTRGFPNAANKGWNSNSAFVLTKEGVLVFDTGSSSTIGKALRKALAGVTDKPIRWVVNSHGHGDHWLGNQAFAGTGVEIISSNHTRSHIAQEGASWVGRFTTMTDGATGDSPIVPPTKIFDSRATLHFGEVRAELLFSGGGHSAGDVLLWLPEERVLFTGDVVNTDSAPATLDANFTQWIAFLKELEALKPKVVIPGHGRVADAAVIKRQREYFETILAVVQSGHQQGKLDHELLPQVLQKLASYKKHYPNLDDRIGRTVSDVYQQVEASAFK